MRKLLRRLLFVLSLAFVVQAAIKLGKDWDSSTVQWNWLYLGLAVPVAVAASFVQAVGFVHLLETWCGQKLPPRLTKQIFFESQLARYTPGRLGLLAVRMARAADLGLPKEQLGAGTLGEVMVWLVTGAGALMLSLLVVGREAFGAYAELSELGYLLAALLAAGAVLLSTLPRRVWLRFLSERFGAKLFGSAEHGDKPLLPVRASLYLFLHWSLWILHGSLLGLAVGLPNELFGLGGAALLLSIFAGFFSFFAPAGVGVREAVMAVALAPWVGAANATLVGVAARASSLVAEVLLFVLYRSKATPASLNHAEGSHGPAASEPGARA